MKAILKQKFALVLVVAISAIAVNSCIKDDIPVIDSGVAIEVSSAELEGLDLINKSASTFTASVTIVDDSGNEIVSDETLTLTRRGEIFKSTALSLDPGEYHLQKFLVNEDNLKSSKKRGHRYVFNYPSCKEDKQSFKVERFFNKMLLIILKKYEDRVNNDDCVCSGCCECDCECPPCDGDDDDGNGCPGDDDDDDGNGGTGDDDDDDDDGEVPTGCETAFAYSTNEFCFLDDEELTTNRWGWTAPIAEEVNDSAFYIYAGAGQCNINAGTNVGTLWVDVNFDSNTTTTEVIVYYELNDPYTLDQVHVYAGTEKYPLDNNNNYTVAPGQYTYVEEGLSGTTKTVTITLNGVDVNEEIWIIAHAVVCGFEEEP